MTRLNTQCICNCTWDSYIMLGVIMTWLLFSLEIKHGIRRYDCVSSLQGTDLRWLFLVVNLTTFGIN